MAAMMQGICSMAALSSTDPLSSMRFQLQPRKSLPDRNASVFIVSSDGRFSGGVNPRSCSVKKLVPNAVAAPADSPAGAKPGHELLLFEALREGLEEEMDQDPQVCVMGEDVGHYGGSYKVTKDLAAKYGDLYVLDIPIALIHGYGHWSSFDWLKANCRRHEHGFPTIGLQPDLTTAACSTTLLAVNSKSQLSFEAQEVLDVSWVLSTRNAWNLTSSLSLAFRWSPVPLPTMQRA